MQQSSDIERAAYIAAHALNCANYRCDAATAGGQQTYKILKELKSPGCCLL